MLQFNIPDQQYILSLDSLDLSILSQYVESSSDELKPLWSKPVEEGRAYYQVEIVSEELLDEDKFIETYKSCYCYICNIDVPQIYYKQHTNSTRHQNYKELVKKVLENVSEQINIDTHRVSNNEEDVNFFCETCCKVVPLTSKRKHKKSNYHLKSIENEQLAAEFLEMYTNSKNIQNNLDSECSSMSETYWSETSDSETENTENYKDSNIVHEKNESITSSPFVGVEELENFQQYLTEMISKYKLDFKLPLVEENSLVIVTPKGYKEKITIDAFHSYKKMDGFAFCLLCQKWVQEYITEHSTSEEHIRNILQPVNNNFAREVVYDKQYSHCLICNERILTASNHVSVKPKHKKYLQSSLPSSTHSIENGESLVDLKNHTIANKEPTQSHLSRKNEIIETQKQKLEAYKTQFSLLSPNNLKCLVCAMTVPNVKTNVIEHVEGKYHREECSVLLLKNNIKKMSHTLYYCNLCSKYMNDFVKHINSHVKSKPQMVKGLGNKNKLKKYVYEDPYNQNPEALQYRERYRALLQQNKIIPSGKSFLCKVCSITLTRISEIDHMFGDRHRLALASSTS